MSTSHRIMAPGLCRRVVTIRRAGAFFIDRHELNTPPHPQTGLSGFALLRRGLRPTCLRPGYGSAVCTKPVLNARGGARLGGCAAWPSFRETGRLSWDRHHQNGGLWRMKSCGSPDLSHSSTGRGSVHTRGIGGTVAAQCRGSLSICCPASSETRLELCIGHPMGSFASTASDGNCRFPHSVY